MVLGDQLLHLFGVWINGFAASRVCKDLFGNRSVHLALRVGLVLGLSQDFLGVVVVGSPVDAFLQM